MVGDVASKVCRPFLSSLAPGVGHERVAGELDPARHTGRGWRPGRGRRTARRDQVGPSAITASRGSRPEVMRRSSGERDPRTIATEASPISPVGTRQQVPIPPTAPGRRTLGRRSPALLAPTARGVTPHRSGRVKTRKLHSRTEARPRSTAGPSRRSAGMSLGCVKPSWSVGARAWHCRAPCRLTAKTRGSSPRTDAKRHCCHRARARTGPHQSSAATTVLPGPVRGGPRRTDFPHPVAGDPAPAPARRAHVTRLVNQRPDLPVEFQAGHNRIGTGPTCNDHSVAASTCLPVTSKLHAVLSNLRCGHTATGLTAHGIVRISPLAPPGTRRRGHTDDGVLEETSPVRGYVLARGITMVLIGPTARPLLCVY